MDQRYEKGAEETAAGTQWHSFSGHERNCFFLNQEGREFSDQSALSGLDQIADSRSFVLWDFDHDGATDIGLVNANYPLLNLYHNQLARHNSDSAQQHSFVALQLTGGNATASPNSELSARDAYGTAIRIRVGDRWITREHRCGEGFAAQNSATMLIGLGPTNTVDELLVRWPSGKTDQHRDLPTRALIQLFETADVSPNGTKVNVTSYEAATLAWPNVSEPPRTPRTRVAARQLDMAKLLSHEAPSESAYYLLTTMATWCEACHRHHPHLQRLAQRFGDRLTLLGIPVDPIETPEELRQHAQSFQIPYRILTDIDPEQRDAIVNLIRREYDTESIPSSVLINRDGQVLEIYLGTPTASDLGRWFQGPGKR